MFVCCFLIVILWNKYEVLRISSVAPIGLTHEVKEDSRVTINGKEYTLPGGCMLNMNISYIQRGNSDKEHWKNKQYGLKMDQLCLQNWLNPENGKFEMNESFVTFGIGTRDCPGQQLALKELHLVLAYWILNYQFRLVKNDPSFKVKRRFGIVYSIETKDGVAISKRV